MPRIPEGLLSPDEVVVSHLGATIAQLIPGPAPVAPVIDELQDVGGPVNEKRQGGSGGPTGVGLGGAKGLRVIGSELMVIRPDAFPGQAGKLSEMPDAPNVTGLQSVFIENPPVVRHLVIGLVNHATEALFLVGPEPFRRQPLAFLEESPQAKDSSRVSEIADSEINGQ
jgi:hypothetical protein